MSYSRKASLERASQCAGFGHGGVRQPLGSMNRGPRYSWEAVGTRHYFAHQRKRECMLVLHFALLVEVREPAGDCPAGIIALVTVGELVRVMIFQRVRLGDILAPPDRSNLSRSAVACANYFLSFERSRFFVLPCAGLPSSLGRCNFDPSQRCHWINLAVEMSLHENACAAVWLDVPVGKMPVLAEHNHGFCLTFISASFVSWCQKQCCCSCLDKYFAVNLRASK